MNESDARPEYNREPRSHGDVDEPREYESLFSVVRVSREIQTRRGDEGEESLVEERRNFRRGKCTLFG